MKERQFFVVVMSQYYKTQQFSCYESQLIKNIIKNLHENEALEMHEMYEVTDILKKLKPGDYDYTNKFYIIELNP